MGKAIAILVLTGFILFGIATYKMGKEETYYRPCGGGRHNA